MGDPKHSGSRYASLAGVGAAALVVVCCAAGPALVGLAAGLGVAALLGASAAVLAGIALVGGTVIAVRARRRRACQPTTRKE